LNGKDPEESRAIGARRVVKLRPRGQSSPHLRGAQRRPL